MGSGYPISAKTYKDSNFTVRKDAEGRLLDKVRGSDFEGVEYFDEACKAVIGLDPDATRYRYHSRERDGFTVEPAGTGDVWRSDDPYTPAAALNTLNGLYPGVVDQWWQVINALLRTSAGGDPDELGVLCRWLGINSGLASGTERLLGWSKYNTPPKTLAQLVALTEDLNYDEYWNTGRPKTAVMTLHDGEVKVWDWLACQYPSALGVNNRTLGNENLLCHVDLWDENLNALTGATALASILFNSSTAARYYIAFGTTIRRFDRFLRAEAHTGVTYELTGGGSGNVTSMAVNSSRIFYLQSGVVRSMTPTGGSDSAITFRVANYDTNTTYTTITDFDELIQCNGFVGARKGDQIFIIVGTGTTQTGNERIDLLATPDKVIGLSQVIDWQVPLRRYVTDSGRAYNTTLKGRNLLAFDGNNAQLIGQHACPQADEYSILNFPPGTYARNTFANGHWFDTSGPIESESRIILRIDCEQLRSDPAVAAGGELRLRGLLAVRTDGQNNGGTLDCYLWTPSPIAWPPTAGATHFTAVGALKGSFTYAAITGGGGATPIGTAAVELIHCDFGTIDLADIHTDDYLYLILKQNSKAPTVNLANTVHLQRDGSLGGLLYVTVETDLEK